ncbi:hypothetical protein PROFUN_03522 [Planoprotostelium fungivorum]|uniref:Micro-fibrillar-associated protein 1 C-terminal domain-containing protein n=1 Tax=Planoprotostelium fungivorum TaxID=1890364 RepID=A0A2P6MNC3_9EUKA|nr:hypothetical protein PROFUN_03522 [Planoprotostelium fungivorum]
MQRDTPPSFHPQPVKPARYRAGQLPEYAKKVDLVEVPVPPKREPDTSDPRLQRLARRNQDTSSSDRRRRHVEAEVIEEATGKNEESTSQNDDGDGAGDKEVEGMNKILLKINMGEVDTRNKTVAEMLEEEEQEQEEHDNRRERARRMARAREEEEEIEKLRTADENMAEPEGENRSGDDEDDEEDDEEEEEEEEERPRIAPVFRKKEDRTTQSAEAQLRDVEEAARIAAEKRLEERKLESAELVRLEAERNATGEGDDKELPDELSDGDGDPTEEYEAWKLRELMRIKTEREEKAAEEAEKAELERRRTLTDEQIREEDKEKLAPKEKGKMKFMQKYYHKGAYFRSFDEKDEIANRWDVTQPTLEDKSDKSILPSVMQVKNFGKRSRTKYTHLVDQDTTQRDAGWSTKDAQSVTDKMRNKMGGAGPVERSKRQKY